MKLALYMERRFDVREDIYGNKHLHSLASDKLFPINKSVLSVVFVISLNQLSSDWDSNLGYGILITQINFRDAFNAYLPATARN